MKRLLTLLFLLVVAPAAAVATPSELYVNAPRDGFLNLRIGPGTQYHVIDKMPHAAPVEVLYRGHSWYKVAYGHRIGWAHKRFLDIEKHYAPHREHHRYPRAHAPKYDAPPHHEPQHHRALYLVHVPHHAYLNMRGGPGTGYHVKAKMRHGAKVRVLGPRHGNWVRVAHLRSGYRGWVHSRYLRAY